MIMEPGVCKPATSFPTRLYYTCYIIAECIPSLIAKAEGCDAAAAKESAKVLRIGYGAWKSAHMPDTPDPPLCSKFFEGD